MDEFNELFETFEHSLFRLEELPEYRTGGEDEPLRLWRAHAEPPASIKNTPWQQDLRKWKAQHKKMQRVRVLKAPLTDYVRMSIEWWYPLNIEAGEETLALDADHHEAAVPEHDFWLFDDRRVALMHYNADGSFDRPEVLAADIAPKYVSIKQSLLAAAEPLEVAYRRLLTAA